MSNILSLLKILNMSYLKMYVDKSNILYFINIYKSAKPWALNFCQFKVDFVIPPWGGIATMSLTPRTFHKHLLGD